MDPDGPPPEDAGLFGLTTAPDDARFWVLPVPIEVTVSSRAGTARAPEAIRRESHQVDLDDEDFGEVWRAGVHTVALDEALLEENDRVRATAERAIAAFAEDRAVDVSEVDGFGARVRAMTHGFARGALDAQKVPVVLGGDHSAPQGAIEAALEDGPLTILQLDAHADLRASYEGFRYSHASIMNNVLEAEGVQLLQFGLRDLSAAERARINKDHRVTAVFDRQLREGRLTGRSAALLDEFANRLPEGRLWLSFDVDGLDPALCPSTGTPVPGGVTWDEICGLLTRVRGRGCRVVGLDLVEVGDAPWDANVGARLLYKMMGVVNES